MQQIMIYWGLGSAGLDAGFWSSRLTYDSRMDDMAKPTVVDIRDTNDTTAMCGINKINIILTNLLHGAEFYFRSC
jgi:hypothetical protein